MAELREHPAAAAVFCGHVCVLLLPSLFKKRRRFWVRVFVRAKNVCVCVWEIGELMRRARRSEGKGQI
jgi:hypothetical protein